MYTETEYATSLPALIPLCSYVPERPDFDWGSFDPTAVQDGGDLPPYLALGPLDAASFTERPEGWSATYRGPGRGTELELEYIRERGFLALHQKWRWFDGGTTVADRHVPFDQVVGELLYRRFPPAWSNVVPEVLQSLWQVQCMLTSKGASFVTGVPDGALCTVAIPTPIGSLRALGERVAAFAAERPFFPLSAEARLVTRVVRFGEKTTLSAGFMAHLRASVHEESGIAPTEEIEFGEARGNRLTSSLECRVYLACITVPFTGLVPVLQWLAGPDGPIRSVLDPELPLRSIPLIVPAIAAQLGRSLDVRRVDGEEGCQWTFADPLEEWREYEPDYDDDYDDDDEDEDEEESREAQDPDALLRQAELHTGLPPNAEEGRGETQWVTLAEHREYSGCEWWDAVMAALPRLLQKRDFRKALIRYVGPQGWIAAAVTGDAWPAEDWCDHAESVAEVFEASLVQVLVLEWNSDQYLGSSGASWLGECAGLYLFRSSDWPTAGPFESVEEALQKCDSFSIASPNPEVSGTLPLDTLLRVARSVLDDPEGEVRVEGVLYALQDGELRPIAE